MNQAEFPIRQLAADVDVAASHLNNGQTVGEYAVVSAYHSDPLDGRQAHSVQLAPISSESSIEQVTVASGYSSMDYPIQTLTIEHRMERIRPAEVPGFLGKLAVRVLRPTRQMTEMVSYEQPSLQDHPWLHYTQTEHQYLFGGRRYIGSDTLVSSRNGEVLQQQVAIAGLHREVAGLVPSTTAE